MDGDGEMFAVRYMRLAANANVLTALLRYTRVNVGGAVPDTRHTIAPGPEDWWSLDLTYRRPTSGGWIEASVGTDHRDRQWNDTSALLPRFSVSWRHEFD